VIPRAAPRRGGLALALGLAGTLAAADAAALALAVVGGEGDPILTVDLPPDGRWCLVWNHSVTGIEVADCFRAGPGGMVLESSHQPDFAAGLGDLPGEGRVRSDGAGGYVIEGLSRPVPEAGLALRRGGPAVAQRFLVDGRTLPLPPGPRGERLLVRLLSPAAGGHAPSQAPRTSRRRQPRPLPAKKPGEQCRGCGGGERPAVDRQRAIDHEGTRARTRAHLLAPTGASRATGSGDRGLSRQGAAACGTPLPAAGSH
jgi:hypothetical protein